MKPKLRLKRSGLNPREVIADDRQFAISGMPSICRMRRTRNEERSATLPAPMMPITLLGDAFPKTPLIDGARSGRNGNQPEQTK